MENHRRDRECFVDAMVRLGLLIWFLGSTPSSVSGQIERVLELPGASGETFEDFEFLRDDALLVARSSNCMAVWNIDTKYLRRNERWKTESCILDPKNERAYYLGEDSKLYQVNLLENAPAVPLSIAGRWFPRSVAAKSILLCESAETKGLLQLFDVQTGTSLLDNPLVMNDELTAALLIEDGQRVVVTTRGREDCIRVYDIQAKEWIASSEGLLADASAPCISPDRKMIAVSCIRGGKRCISLVDTETLRPIGKAIQPRSYEVSKRVRCAFTNDSQRLIFADDGHPILFNVKTQLPIAEFVGMIQGGSSNDSFAFSSNGKMLAVASPQGGKVELWDWETLITYRDPAVTMKTHAAIQSLGSQSKYDIQVRFEPDGQKVALAIPKPSNYGPWGGPGRNAMASVMDSISDGVMIKGGEKFGSDDVGYLLWLDCRSREVLATASTSDVRFGEKTAHGFGFESLSFSADGKLLACVCDSWAVVWERNGNVVRSHTTLPSFVGDQYYGARLVALSPAGDSLHVIHTSEELGYQQYDLRGRKKILQTAGNFGANLSFVNDSKFVSGLAVFDRSDGQELFRSNGFKSFDGRCMVERCTDKTVICWQSHDVAVLDIESGRFSQPLVAHKGDGPLVHDCKVSPNGRLVATACQDSFIRVWSASTGQLLKIMKGHTDVVDSIDFSSNGKALASASRDGTLRFWNVGDLVNDTP